MGVASRHLLSLVDSTIADLSASQLMRALTNDGVASFEEFAVALRKTLGGSEQVGEVDGDGTIFGLIESFETGARAAGMQVKALRARMTSSSSALRICRTESIIFKPCGR